MARIILTSEQPAQLTTEQDDDGAERRAFKMTGYTGAPVQTAFGDMIVDLAGMSIPDGRLAILDQHDAARRAGFAERVEVVDGALELEGELLSNEIGAAIARDADDGFPFQASIGFDFAPDDITRLGDDESREVNGREFTGGAVVETSTLRETSFVSLGADGATTAAVFGLEGLTRLEDPMDSDQPDTQALIAQGAASARVELAELTAAIPGRHEFVLAQFAAGSTVLEARAALADVLEAEASQPRAMDADEAERAQLVHEIDQLRAENDAMRRQPGVAFRAAEIETQPDTRTPDERAQAKWDADEDLRHEFGGQLRYYLAYLREQTQDKE